MNPKPLTTLDGNALMAQVFEPLQFTVEKLLPYGLFILAGSPQNRKVVAVTRPVQSRCRRRQAAGVFRRAGRCSVSRTGR